MVKTPVPAANKFGISAKDPVQSDVPEGNTVHAYGSIAPEQSNPVIFDEVLFVIISASLPMSKQAPSEFKSKFASGFG